MEVRKEQGSIVPVVAVAGRVDLAEVGRVPPEKRVVEVAGRRIASGRCAARAERVERPVAGA